MLCYIHQTLANWLFVCFSQRTPLHVAVEGGRVVTVECIVTTNPDIINIQDKKGVNIWDYTTEIR